MNWAEIINFDEAHVEDQKKWIQFFETHMNQNEIDSIKSTIQQISWSSEVPVVHSSDGRQFKIDFLNDRLNYQKKKASIKSELLSKAMGKSEKGLRILDLTAGLGIDAVFLAQLGYQVTAIERNPIIFLCLQEALRQAQNNKQLLNLEFKFGQSAEWFVNQNCDVLYFDPMFPDKKKSALPKQEMVIFKKLVGADEDADQVIEKILSLSSAQRLVVKRPLKAAPLFSKPHHQLFGKLIRFDIYNPAHKNKKEKT